jgi:hypothetical protein
MPTLQIWLSNDRYEMLLRLQKYLDSKQEDEFEGKTHRYSESASRRGLGRHRIKRKRINFSTILSEALTDYWADNEQQVIRFERDM